MTLQSILTAHPCERLHATLQTLKADYTDQRRARAFYDQTRRELSAMSKRDLADIGIHSSDISKIASEAAAMSRRKH